MEGTTLHFVQQFNSLNDLQKKLNLKLEYIFLDFEHLLVAPFWRCSLNFSYVTFHIWYIVIIASPCLSITVTFSYLFVIFDIKII